MIEYKLVDKDVFFDIITTITYREDDEKEAKAFNCLSVVDCYHKSPDRFNKYFIVYEDDRPVAPIILARNANLTFFISKTINSPIGVIRCLKDLAKKTVDCCGPIVTKTATWYDEAQRMNKIIGFRPMAIYDGYGHYVMGY